MPRSPFDGALSLLLCLLFVNVEKTQLLCAKRWQCITRLINKSETTVMVSRLIPHRSSNILLCLYFCPSYVDCLLCSYSCPSSVDSYCVLIPVRLSSNPRIVLLLTTFLVPSLIVGYLPTPSAIRSTSTPTPISSSSIPSPTDTLLSHLYVAINSMYHFPQ